MPPTKAIKAATSAAPLKKWNMETLRALLAELRAHLASGKDDLQVMDEMGVTPGEYNTLKRELYAQEKLELQGRGPEEVYIDYVLQQRKCIKDLDDVLGKFTTTKQYNAVVGAVRAKSDILDKLIVKGKELGVIREDTEANKVVAGFLVVGMNAEELRTAVAKQAGMAAELLQRYGEMDMLGGGIAPTAAAPAATKATPARPAPVAGKAKLPTHAPKPATPAFSATGKPKTAVGGLAKAAGGRATAKPPPLKKAAPGA